MRSPSRVLLATATAGCLAACAGVPPPSNRVVPYDPATVSDRIRAEMGSLGLTVTSGDNGVISARATNAPADCASCPPALVGRGGGAAPGPRAATEAARPLGPCGPVALIT